jgi:NADH:ubiquinone oxidoreductase subunit 4 (subunit M)
MNLYFIILLGNIGHGGFCFSIMQHSILIALMFFVCDIIKDVYKTRSIEELQKINTIKSNTIGGIIFICFMTLISVPLSWGFISEVISIYALSKISITYSCLTGFAILILSVYTIYIYHLVFGRSKNPKQNYEIEEFKITDLYRKTTLCILLSITFFIGIFPDLILGR